MSDKPKPCAHCGSDNLGTHCYAGSYYIYCRDCSVGTGRYASAVEALAAWNRRALPWVPVAERLPEPEQVCLWWGRRIRKPLVSSYAEGLDTAFFTHWLPLTDDFFPAAQRTKCENSD